jgi:hypothetical protein
VRKLSREHTKSQLERDKEQIPRLLDLLLWKMHQKILCGLGRQKTKKERKEKETRRVIVVMASYY